MKHLLVLIFAAALTLSACGSAVPITEILATEIVVDSSMPVPSTEVVSPTEIVAMETYVDEAYGFSFDYPAGWMLDVIALGDRAPHSIQLTSWTHEPGMIADVVAGGTAVNIIVQLWDPKADLAAFIQQRTDAWSASGMSILSQEALILVDGRSAREFVVQSVDGEGYFFFTTLGDQYLVISGSGDMHAVRLITRSVR